MFIVTGANGFIGSALVRHLNQNGHKDILCVDSVDLTTRPEPLRNAQYADFMTTPNFLSWCAAGQNLQNVKALFHMGAISSTTETDWAKLVENNITLSQKLFQFCQAHNVHYIYASSGAVYGNGDHGFFDDKSPSTYTALNLYGRSKLEFDAWALAQSTKPTHWHGLRFFNVYGPNEYHKGDMASVVYKAFLQIRSEKRLKLFRSHNVKYKDGEQLRDFVYVKDIARWMHEIYLEKKIPNGIYNQGYGSARSWLDLAKNVFQAMDLPLNIEWIDIPQSIRNQYQYFTKAEMDRAFHAGLSHPRYSLEDGVKDYLKNYLLTDNPYL